MVGDVSTLNAQELRARAGEGLACVLEVAKKSGNLKGEFIARLKRSASTIREVVEALASRSEAEETRRLRGENSRLRLEVESCKAEIKALRRGFSEARTEAAAATTAAAAASSASGTAAPPTVQIGAELVEELKRSLTVTFGQMLNARLAGIEDRLMPEPTIRPPLRADARKAAAATSPPKPTPEPTRVPPSEAGKRDKQAPKTAAAPSVAPVAGPSMVTQSPSETAPPTGPQAETWAKVVGRKGKGKGKGKGSNVPPVAPVAGAPTTTLPKPKTARVSLRPAKSAAVVLSLQPEAVERGVTYSDALKVAQERVNLRELGIDQVRFRQTATGARMLEIPGSESAEKADKLAEKLRGVLSEVANVARPFKSADLRISGLDDSATQERVAAAVAEAGACGVQLVKVGEIHRSMRGTGSTLVSCPVSAAKVLRDKGRLLIGWSSVQVVALEARPMRCFRCLGLGHTRLQCPASADRGDLCFRCGGTGHRASSCGRIDPRCAICAESGRPFGHVMGGRKCAPPKTLGRAFQRPTAAAAPASEEVEMAE